jgi:hypothetical protein
MRVETQIVTGEVITKTSEKSLKYSHTPLTAGNSFLETKALTETALYGVIKLQYL